MESTKSRGAMFVRRQKNHPQAPDLGGDFVLQGEMLAYVANALQQGASEVKLRISGWNERTRKNDPMIKLAIDEPFPDNGQQGGYSRGNSGGYGGQRQGFGQQRQGGYSQGGGYGGQRQQGYGQQQGRQQLNNARPPVNDPLPGGNDLDDAIPF